MKRHTARWKDAHILVVEDDLGDQEITRRALRRDGFLADLHMVTNGRQAMDFLLSRAGDPAGSPGPLPDLPSNARAGKPDQHKDRRLMSTEG